MKAYAVNGQTASTKGFSGILYRVTAMLAGFDSGTFLTESAASIGGFTFGPCATADFDSRWTGAGANVIHPNFAVSRMIPVVRIIRETARVERWAKVDGEAVTLAHRAHVAKLANQRFGMAKAFARQFEFGADLLAISDDSDAVRHAVAVLSSPDGSPMRKAWSDAARHAKELYFLTV